MIPYARCAELFTELFSCPISQATLPNFVKRDGTKATVAMQPVREQLLKTDITHADEWSGATWPARRAARRGEWRRAQTGSRVGGKRHWPQVFSTATLASYHIDKNAVEKK